MESCLEKLRDELNNKAVMYIDSLTNTEIVKLSQLLDNEIIKSQRRGFR